MHKIAYFAIVMVSALSLFACSQTVKAPSQSDEDETAYSSSSAKKNQDDSSKDKQTKKSSSSKASSKKSSSSRSSSKNDNENDDDFFDDGGLVIDTSKITRSGLEFTGEKIDCDFSVDDSVWTIEQVDSISTSLSYITFSDTAMEIEMGTEGEYSDAESCEQAVSIFYFTMMLIEGKDLDAQCDNKKFIAKGTVVDPTKSISDKNDVYKEMCK